MPWAFLAVAPIAWLVGLTVTAGAAMPDGAALVAERCASCHDLTGPAPRTYRGVVARKAPDLFYAGSKFNRAWLVAWLQSPTAIRRSGVMFLNHIADEDGANEDGANEDGANEDGANEDGANEDGKDRIAEATVKPCPAELSLAEAETAADYLMTLQDPAMKTGVVDPAKKLRKHKAYRLFTKQLPCIGCHRIKFGKREMGGVSGPDLTGAGDRLNPDWIYARIENPQYWDPKTWMPRIAMSHRKREMLTLFVSSMK